MDIDIGTISDGDIVVATWNQTVQRPSVIPNETWISFVRPGSDDFGKSMTVVLINDETHDNESTWIKDVKCFSFSNREYSVHVPDGVWYVLPMIYDTGANYRALIPKKLNIVNSETGGYKMVRMDWLPIKEYGQDEFDWSKDYSKSNNFIGLLAVFDTKHSTEYDSFIITAIDISDNSPNNGEAIDIWFDHVVPGDEWDEENSIESCFRAMDFSPHGFSDTVKYRFAIQRTGDDPGMEYDYPNTLGCLYLNGKAYFAKPHKAGIVIDINPPLQMDDNGSVLACMVWFYHTKQVYY